MIKKLLKLDGRYILNPVRWFNWKASNWFYFIKPFKIQMYYWSVVIKKLLK